MAEIAAEVRVQPPSRAESPALAAFPTPEETMKQRQVEAFRAVMQFGSITAAAQALGVTQPAVSRLIADLEYAISFLLFERRGARLLPTREAIELYGEVERMYYGLDRLEHEIGRASGREAV